MATFHTNSSSSSLQLFSTISPYSWSSSRRVDRGHSSSSSSSEEEEERGLYSIHLLLTSANLISAGDIQKANTCLEQLSHLSSPQGDTIHRLIAYFTEALAERLLKSIPGGLYRALNSAKTTLISEQLQARKLFYDLCPFLKLAYAVTNKAILEAIKGEKIVHIIDMDGSQPGQWTPLLREVRRRKEGAPQLRITGVNEKKEMLEKTGEILIREAEELDIGFQYCMVEGRAGEVEMERMKVKRGEALVVSCVLQMHRMLGEGREDGFVKGVRGVEPKLTVVVEKEGDHNGDGVVERVVEALYYYGAMFDSMVMVGGEREEERVKVERMVYGEEIRNIVGCEGVERRERHERVGKWVERMVRGGFWMQKNWGLEEIETGGGYGVKEVGGCVFICWQDTPLFSVSAWTCCGGCSNGGGGGWVF